MLKIRLQGTTNDIKGFQKILQRDKRINVLEMSEKYANGSESSDKVEMRWKRKRDKNKATKNDLNRLQERFENVMRELEYKERTKGTAAYICRL